MVNYELYVESATQGNGSNNIISHMTPCVRRGKTDLKTMGWPAGLHVADAGGHGGGGDVSGGLLQAAETAARWRYVEGGGQLSHARPDWPPTRGQGGRLLSGPCHRHAGRVDKTVLRGNTDRRMEHWPEDGALAGGWNTSWRMKY